MVAIKKAHLKLVRKLLKTNFNFFLGGAKGRRGNAQLSI